MITIEKKNEVFLKVEGEQHIHKELSEHFQFEVPGAKFMPQYKKKVWDGKIRLYSPGTGEIYVGLYDYLLEYLDQKGYEYAIKDSKFFGIPNEEEEYVSPLYSSVFSLYILARRSTFLIIDLGILPSHYTVFNKKAPTRGACKGFTVRALSHKQLLTDFFTGCMILNIALN